MKVILLTLTYTIGAGELILAIYFLMTNSKDEIRRVMSVLAFATGMWVILSGVTSYVPFSNTAYFEMAGVYAFAAILITSVLHLSLIMPYRLYRLDRLHVILLYIPAAFLSYALFFTKTIVVSFSGDYNSVGSIQGGPLFGLYNVFLTIVFFSAIAILVSRVRNLTGFHRRNTLAVLLSILLGGLPGAIMYLVVPVFIGYLPYNSLVGVIPSAIWVGGTSYVLLRQ